MYLFRSLLPPNEDDKHLPEGLSSDQEKLWRVSQLADDERTAFEWFRLGYTAHWTAETMLLDRKTARKLFSGIYRKLGVSDPAELSRIYRTVMLKPEDMPLEE